MSPRAQLSAMTVVTSLSLIYIYAASWLLLDARNVPDLRAIIPFGIAAAICWLPYVVPATKKEWRGWREWIQPRHRLSGAADDGETSQWLDAPGRGFWYEPMRKVVVVMFAIYMIIHLTSMTQFSGGSYRSPFTAIPLGIAMMAPYVTNTRESSGVVWLISLAVFWWFSVERWWYSTLMDDHRWVGWAFLLTLAFASGIAIYISGVTLGKKRSVGGTNQPPSVL